MSIKLGRLGIHLSFLNYFYLLSLFSPHIILCTTRDSQLYSFIPVQKPKPLTAQAQELVHVLSPRVLVAKLACPNDPHTFVGDQFPSHRRIYKLYRHKQASRLLIKG